MAYEQTIDVVDVVTVQLSTSASVLSAEGLQSAVDNAMSELGWSFPVSDPQRMLWVTKRAVRHACFILWVASAQKFKYKQVNLQNRFEHYKILIENMDKEYEDALTTQATIFAGVASYKMFGTLVGAGFAYDFIGRDLTYQNLQKYINVGV